MGEDLLNEEGAEGRVLALDQETEGIAEALAEEATGPTISSASAGAHEVEDRGYHGGGVVEVVVPTPLDPGDAAGGGAGHPEGELGVGRRDEGVLSAVEDQQRGASQRQVPRRVEEGSIVLGDRGGVEATTAHQPVEVGGGAFEDPAAGEAREPGHQRGDDDPPRERPITTIGRGVPSRRNSARKGSMLLAASWRQTRTEGASSELMP